MTNKNNDGTSSATIWMVSRSLDRTEKNFKRYLLSTYNGFIIQP